MIFAKFKKENEESKNDVIILDSDLRNEGNGKN